MPRRTAPPSSRRNASAAPPAGPPPPSTSELAAQLEARRREIARELTARKREVRDAGHGTDRPLLADEGLVPSDVNRDIELQLVQMRAESLKQVEAALSRLARGTHGRCHECQEPIAPARLKALPFAIRCTACETRRESLSRGARTAASRAAHGVCEQCDEPITEARARLVPGAVRCTACEAQRTAKSAALRTPAPPRSRRS